MANNYIQAGDTVEYAAPSPGVVDGVPILVGGLVGIPANTAATGVRVNFHLKGVFGNVPKTAGAAWTEGQTLYWDSTAGSFATAQSATARRAASAALAAASGDTTGTVRLENINAAVNVA
jgi:predicted RecA/RadA family phage recombinase